MEQKYGYIISVQFTLHRDLRDSEKSLLKTALWIACNRLGFDKRRKDFDVEVDKPELEASE